MSWGRRRTLGPVGMLVVGLAAACCAGWRQESLTAHQGGARARSLDPNLSRVDAELVEAAQQICYQQVLGCAGGEDCRRADQELFLSTGPQRDATVKAWLGCVQRRVGPVPAETPMWHYGVGIVLSIGALAVVTRVGLRSAFG